MHAKRRELLVPEEIRKRNTSLLWSGSANSRLCQKTGQIFGTHTKTFWTETAIPYGRTKALGVRATPKAISVASLYEVSQDFNRSFQLLRPELSTVKSDKRPGTLSRRAFYLI